jgi:xanthine dehydrogenase accessory factor
MLTGSDVAKTDMICGGQVEVFLEPVSPGNLTHLSIFQNVIKLRDLGGGGIMATIIDEAYWGSGQVPKMFMNRDGEKIGTLFGVDEIDDALFEKVEEILASGEPLIIPIRDDEGNQIDIFVEPIVSTPVLYIFGAGHVSREIVPLAAKVAFDVVVIDDRAEFANKANFPAAEEVHHYSFPGVIENLTIDEFSYLVIVTRGHMHDKDVLAQALKTEAKYIGMIGSKRKRNIIYDKLLEEGFTENDLSRVHSPIGLSIGAETPAEIAVSIVAELIQVRAGRSH